MTEYRNTQSISRLSVVEPYLSSVDRKGSTGTATNERKQTHEDTDR